MLGAILRFFQEAITGDTIVDLTGASSNHGAGQIDVEGAAEPAPTLSLFHGRPRRKPWRPWRRPPRPPRPDTIVLIDPSAVTVDFVLESPRSHRGVGEITVETPFDVTDDELLAVMMLIAA